MRIVEHFGTAESQRVESKSRACQMQPKGDGVFMRIYEDIKIAERSLTQLILLVAFPPNAEYPA